MTFGIFDNQYELIACLSNCSYSKVYLGLNRAGEKVVVKFLMSSEQFFEELARYYACDDCGYLPRLLYNYPAFSISQAPVFFSRDILKLFDCRELLEREETLTHEQMMDSPMAEVGVLILEYIEGGPLLRELRPLKPAYKLDLLLELATGLRELHRNGEFHGDLTPENVLLDQNSGQIRLIDLGFFPGKKQWAPYALSPEHREGASLGPGSPSDIYMFAFHFLTAVERPNRRLGSLIRRCIRENPLRRPDINDLCQELSRLRRGVRPMKPSFAYPTILKRWSRRMVFAALAFSSLVGITWITIDPIFEKRKNILATAEDQPVQAIEDLKSLRLQAMEAGKEPWVIGDLVEKIARAKWMRPGFPIRPMEESALERPIAVLAFARDPVLVGRDEIYQLGDWVSLGGETGYISDINWRQITVDFNGKNHKITLKKPNFQVPYSMDVHCAVIWGHAGNLPRLMAAIETMLKKTEFSPSAARNPLLAALGSEETKLQVASDASFGSYQASNIEEFLDKLQPRLRIQHTVEGPRISRKENQPPLKLPFRFYNISEGMTLARICQGFEEKTGYRFIVPEELGNQRLASENFADTSWEEMLLQLGFEWEINEENGTYRILVTGKTP